MLNAIESFLLKLFRFCIGIAFFILIAAVTVQVLGRTLGTSPVWTEELTRFALLYLAAIGAGLSFKSGELVNVDVFCESFGEIWSKRMRLISAILTALMCSMLAMPAWRFVSIGKLQTSPAMGLQMTYAHFSVFALIVILFIFSILRILIMVLGDQATESDLHKENG